MLYYFVLTSYVANVFVVFTVIAMIFVAFGEYALFQLPLAISNMIAVGLMAADARGWTMNKLLLGKLRARSFPNVFYLSLTIVAFLGAVLFTALSMKNFDYEVQIILVVANTLFLTFRYIYSTMNIRDSLE